MLKLHGFAVSNYYNMVKLALLEKGLPFEEVTFYPAQTAESLAISPRGKVPVLGVDAGFINETAIILEYLEQTQKGAPLLPSDPFERAQVLAIAKAAADGTTVGDPASGATIGPVISATQWDKIQTLIERGIEEGAGVVAGGPGKPAGLETGYYVKPTVLGPVKNTATIAREEIFGPVLTILGYDTVDEAIAIANDTPYGLAAYVSGTDPEATRQVASRLRAGQVNINSAAPDLMAPFGGFKQSGNGREWGEHAFGEFLEVKAVLGYAPK